MAVGTTEVVVGGDSQAVGPGPGPSRIIWNVAARARENPARNARRELRSMASSKEFV